MKKTLSNSSHNLRKLNLGATLLPLSALILVGIAEQCYAQDGAQAPYGTAITEDPCTIKTMAELSRNPLSVLKERFSDNIPACILHALAATGFTSTGNLFKITYQQLNELIDKYTDPNRIPEDLSIYDEFGDGPYFLRESALQTIQALNNPPKAVEELTKGKTAFRAGRFEPGANTHYDCCSLEGVFSDFFRPKIIDGDPTLPAYKESSIEKIYLGPSGNGAIAGPWFVGYVNEVVRLPGNYLKKVWDTSKNPFECRKDDSDIARFVYECVNSLNNTFRILANHQHPKATQLEDVIGKDRFKLVTEWFIEMWTAPPLLHDDL